MILTPLIDRKELASLARVSTDSIRRNEGPLGLDKKGVRIEINARVIRYKRKAAIAALRRIGLVQF